MLFIVSRLDMVVVVNMVFTVAEISFAPGAVAEFQLGMGNVGTSAYAAAMGEVLRLVFSLPEGNSTEVLLFCRFSRPKCNKREHILAGK